MKKTFAIGAAVVHESMADEVFEVRGVNADTDEVLLHGDWSGIGMCPASNWVSAGKTHPTKRVRDYGVQRWRGGRWIAETGDLAVVTDERCRYPVGTVLRVESTGNMPSATDASSGGRRRLRDGRLRPPDAPQGGAGRGGDGQRAAIRTWITTSPEVLLSTFVTV